MSAAVGYSPSVARRILDEIEATAKELGRAERDLEKLRTKFRGQLVAAYHDHQVRPGAIQDAAGISKQRLHQILQSEKAKAGAREPAPPAKPAAPAKRAAK